MKSVVYVLALVLPLICGLKAKMNAVAADREPSFVSFAKELFLPALPPDTTGHFSNTE